MYVWLYVRMCYYVLRRVIFSIHMQFRDASVYKHELSMSRTAMNLLLLFENYVPAQPF